MKNHTLEILQLYEYSMSIGQSIKYSENCNQFLQLILKRKSLNACWIIKNNDTRYKLQFAIPKGKITPENIHPKLSQLLEKIETYHFFEFDPSYLPLCPIAINKGHIAIYNLNEEGFLFLYSKTPSFTDKSLSQLQPVISKFYNALKACRVFKNQKKLLNELEIQNQELNDYAHIVSHDLKSPLRNIYTLITWLKQDASTVFSAQENEYISLIKRNLLKMETLISGILEFSTIRLKLFKKTNINLHELVQEILQFIHIPKNVQIHLKNTLPIVKGDTHRLQQLMQNLIQNAIKYNDKKNPVIEIGANELETHHELFIKDNGIGIEPQFHKKIFNVFQKLEEKEDSSGIGLSIAKKIVNSYGGEIYLDSEPGKGTTFYFTLSKDSNL